MGPQPRRVTCQWSRLWMGEIIEVEKVVYLERVSKRILEQVDVPVPVVVQQQVFLNSRWETVTGGDAGQSRS